MKSTTILAYFVLWVRIVFGTHSLLSGLNYFLNFLPQPPIDTSPAGPFVMQMTHIGLFAIIKLVEVIVGFCLLFNIFVPAALVLEFPTTISIFYLSVVVVGHGRPVYTGWRELFFNSFLLAAYAGYFLPALRAKAPLRELWTPSVASAVIPAIRGQEKHA